MKANKKIVKKEVKASTLLLIGQQMPIGKQHTAK